MITSQTVLKKINSYQFEDEREQQLASMIQELAAEYAKGNVSIDEYKELLNDIQLNNLISDKSSTERRLQNLYFLALILLRVA